MIGAHLLEPGRQKGTQLAVRRHVAVDLRDRGLQVAGHPHARHQHQRHAAVEHNAGGGDVLAQVEFTGIGPGEGVAARHTTTIFPASAGSVSSAEATLVIAPIATT